MTRPHSSCSGGGAKAWGGTKPEEVWLHLIFPVPHYCLSCFKGEKAKALGSSSSHSQWKLEFKSFRAPFPHLCVGGVWRIPSFYFNEKLPHGGGGERGRGAGNFRLLEGRPSITSCLPLSGKFARMGLSANMRQIPTHCPWGQGWGHLIPHADAVDCTMSALRWLWRVPFPWIFTRGGGRGGGSWGEIVFLGEEARGTVGSCLGSYWRLSNGGLWLPPLSYPVTHSSPKLWDALWIHWWVTHLQMNFVETGQLRLKVTVGTHLGSWYHDGTIMEEKHFWKNRRLWTVLIFGYFQIKIKWEIRLIYS
jgi:hypothetical protein